MRIDRTPSALGTGLIDRIMESEAAPMTLAKSRRERTVSEKNEYSSLAGMLGELGKVSSGMSLPQGFSKLALESSHPDILGGKINGPAMPGSYEFEVQGLAKADRLLAAGFQDADRTPVGFGFMLLEKADGGSSEIVIQPGSTLRDVAAQISEKQLGVKAQVINTGAKDEPFRLMVTNEQTGEAARIKIDPDTTFLDFADQRIGRDLKMKFEDVDIKREENKLADLLGGVHLEAKQAAPGTKVTVQVKNDVDQTAQGIKEFAEKYNQVARFAQSQSQMDPATGHAGKLSGDSGIRQIMRGLQSEITAQRGDSGGTYRSLAEVGLKTNAKTGELEIDESKLKAALQNDYGSVANLFVAHEN
ncbi:hypothetical protein E3A20_10730, partial [Planctomyces bekefii]